MAFVRLTSDADLTQFKTVFQAVVEGYKAGTGRVFRNAINLTSRWAEQNFRASIERDEHSATLGGQVYRPGSRATGRFTFGPGKTFTGSLLKNLGPNISGFGYPIAERAERLTDGAWRALEFGRPAFTMPPGYWRDSQGNRVRSRSFGGDEFVPARRGRPIEAHGIEAKQFITTAFEDVVARYVEPELRKLAQQVADKAAK